MSALDRILKKIAEEPEVVTQGSVDSSGSLVDSILKAGESGPVEPEDQFGKPKQLSTIAGLRKKGFDNARIFKAMELEEAEAESTDSLEPDTTPEKPTPEPAMYAKKDNIWERLTKPTTRFFLGGGLKKTIGATGMALGTTTPREERQVFSQRQGYGYTVPEITREQALIETAKNPLYREGSAMFASGLEDFANRPDLQPSDSLYDYQWSDPEFIASAIGEALPSFLTFIVPAASTALVTRNPVATMGVTMSTAFGLETGSMMETAMENGLSPRDASNVAITVGTINAMISALPAATLFSKFGIGKKPLNDVMVKKIISKQLFKDMSTKGLVQGVSEVTEELLQEGVNIIAETQALGIELSPEEFAKRLQAVTIGSFAMGGTTGSIAGVAQTGTRVENTKQKIKEEEAITIESQAKKITEDQANDFNIVYDKEDSGSMELSEDEIKASGYEIDLNNIPVAREDEYGNKFYAVKVKGETDSEGNIRLTSSADRSTILEEAIEARLKRLQKSKKAEDKQIIEKINFWTESVRKKASEMGLNLRFSEGDEGNIELFSDAILYTKGGFTGLSKEFEDIIYIPDDISNEFIANFGEMSDGSSVFEMLQGSEKGIQANQEFASAVDADIASQMEKAAEKTRPPPAKPSTKSKIAKQDESGTYQLEPDVIKKAVELYPDVMAVDKKGKPGPKADRLRLTVERRKNNPKVGRQNNNRVEFELKNGGVIILGRDKTPEDWIRQVVSILDEDEIMKSKDWYEDAYPAFVEEFGEADAVNYMVAWLLGNVQASPQQALSNTFLGAEQLKATMPSWKSPGTGMVARNIKDVLQGKRAETGAGAKLYDFLDSALGKETRTIMQDDKRGFRPVAIDRHTYRDAGFVDGGIRNILKRLAKDPERVKRLRYDSRGSSPQDTQYEYAVQYMNELTDALNEMNWMGGNLKPHQVQAIGWTAIARLAESSDGQSIPSAMQLQKPTVAFAVEFGTDTPYAAKYGEAWTALDKNDQVKLTNKIVNEVVPELAKELGLKVNSIASEGFGFWGDVGEDGPEANTTMNVRGSSQAVKAFMNSIGILFQQDEIGLLTRGGNKGLGMIYSHPELSNPEMQEAVYTILREETKNEFTPGAVNEVVDGTPSLVIGTFINQDQFADYSEDLRTALDRIRNELGLELNYAYGGLKYENTTNNWSKDSQGERYRNQTLETHKQFLLERLDNHYGPKVEKLLESAFSRQAEQQRRTRQLVPDPDYAAEIRAAFQDPTNLDLTNFSLSDFISEKLYDKLQSVVTWQRDVEEQMLGGNRLRDHMNVSLAAELFVGKVPEMLRDFNKKIIEVSNKDSFISRLSNAGITTEDFNQYLHALHAKERNDKMGEDGLSGMTNQQARTIKTMLNKKHGLKKLKAFVREFRNDIIDASLLKRLEGGLISQEDYDNMTGAYKNYVPLFRVMDNKEAVIDNSKKGVNAFDVKGKEFKRAKGSKRQVKNILVSSIEQYHEAVIRSEKNNVNKRMLDLINAYPSEAFEVRGLKHRPSYDENGEIDYMIPMEGVRDNEDAIHVKVDGRVKQIVFKGEQGIRIARAMKDLGATKGVKYLYAFNNYLRYVNTIADPNFMVTNFVRDIQTAGINISAEQGNAITLQALNPRNLKNAWKSVFNLVQNDDIDSEWGQLYERMRKAGGKTGFFDYQTIEDKVAQVEKDLKRVESTGRGIKVAGKSIFTFVENLNEATESAVRLTLFKAMLDNGYSEEQAASGAKNVTINFNRKGEWGQYLNSMYLFANAGLQGTGRIIGVVARNKKAQAAVSALAAMGVAESFYNNMADDDEEYEKLTNWDKDNNFIFRYGEGDKFFKMRLPYGYNVFKVVGNIAGDIAWRQMQGEPVEYTSQMLRFLEAANSAFNPIGSGPIEQIISPTAIDPLIQLSTNKAFHGGPIRPETIYGPMKADVEQAWERTPEVYKDMAQWIFKHGNGTIRYDKDGGIDSAVRGPGIYGDVTDISPETIEYFVDYLGGGLGKTVARTVNTAKGAVNYDADYSKAPFVRTFYGKFDKKSETRYLYNFEKKMKIKLYDGPTRLKYLRYLESYYKKGNLTRKEYRLRYKRFVKAQREVQRTMQ